MVTSHHLLEVEREGIFLLSWEDKVLVGQPPGKVAVLLGLVVLSVEGDVVGSLEQLLREVVTGEV